MVLSPKSENRCAHRERNGKQGDSKLGVLPNGRHLEVCNPEEIRFQGGHESCLQIFDTGEGVALATGGHEGEVPAQAKKELSRWPKLPPDGMNWPALHCREFPVKGRYERAGGTVTWQVGCPLSFRALDWMIPAGCE